MNDSILRFAVIGLAGLVGGPALSSDIAHRSILEMPSIASFAWSGNDRIVVLSRRYRRGEVQLFRLSKDLKAEYASVPDNLGRMMAWQTIGASVSPDGRWLLGGDVRGPRVYDLSTGETQSWPGDVRSGFWLSDGAGWMEIVHLKIAADDSTQDRVERDLNSKSMELRLFEAFGDEWPNSPVRKSKFSIPYEAAVLGAISREELLIGAQAPPSRADLTLYRLKTGRGARLSALPTVACPRGGEICDVALSPDRRSIAVLSVKPLPTETWTLLPESTRRAILSNPTEYGYVAEVLVTPLDRSAPRLVFSRTVEDDERTRAVGQSPSASVARPRSLQWRPDGKLLGYVSDEKLILFTP